jgi:REP element-mobilizing transposase RayT
MRAWLLTWTTYGTWLPGDARGSVSRVRESESPRRYHNTPGSPYDGPMPGLHSAAEAALKGRPILLNSKQAECILAQFRETAADRHWRLPAAAVMRNHVHLVVLADDAAKSTDLVRTFKSYASRALNAENAKPIGGRWWTTSASRRSLPEERAIAAAVRYVREQPGALAVYAEPLAQKNSGG